MLSDDLFARAVATRGTAQCEVELAELEDLLRYDEFGRDVTPVAVSTTKYTLMCSTCGYETDFGTIEARDACHLVYDGAHEPGWYSDVELIRSDMDLIRAIVAAV